MSVVIFFLNSNSQILRSPQPGLQSPKFLRLSTTRDDARSPINSLLHHKALVRFSIRQIANPLLIDTNWNALTTLLHCRKTFSTTVRRNQSFVWLMNWIIFLSNKKATSIITNSLSLNPLNHQFT